MLPRGGAVSLPLLFPSALLLATGPPSRGRREFPGWGRGQCLRPHRAGQFGKILPRKLDHIPHPQDGAERGLVRVEAACLYVGGRQVGKQVTPVEEKRREARPRVNVKTVLHQFFSRLTEPQGPPGPGTGI